MVLAQRVMWKEQEFLSAESKEIKLADIFSSLCRLYKNLKKKQLYSKIDTRQGVYDARKDSSLVDAVVGKAAQREKTEGTSDAFLGPEEKFLRET